MIKMVSKKIVVQAIIEKVESEFNDVEIRTSVVEGYERPETISPKGDSDKGYIPDVMLTSSEGTEIYEVEMDKQYEVDKWKLFSLYSSKNNGELNIVTPEEKLPELRAMLNDNDIKAKIIYFT